MNEITDQLWIGDIQDARELPTDRFDRVVTVCQDSVEDNVGCEYVQVKLADGPHAAGQYGGNCNFSTFAEAADAVLDALESGEVVLVHCHAGASRAPSVSAAALAVQEGRDYHSAFGLVGAGRPQTNPDPLLKDHVRTYIESRG